MILVLMEYKMEMRRVLIVGVLVLMLVVELVLMESKMEMKQVLIVEVLVLMLVNVFIMQNVLVIFVFLF